MRQRYLDLAFTPSVQRMQEHYGSRGVYERQAGRGDEGDDAGLGDREKSFLAMQDGFFLATVSETGWPYVQFRGGPPGFLRVLGPTTVGWADFRGNRQYVSVGNADHDGRAAIIVVDYARRARVKLAGRLTIRDATEAPDLAAALAVRSYSGHVERAVTMEVAAFDWNCPQHIMPRYSEHELAEGLAPLRQHIADLEAEVAALRATRATADGSGVTGTAPSAL